MFLSSLRYTEEQWEKDSDHKVKTAKELSTAYRHHKAEGYPWVKRNFSY